MHFFVSFGFELKDNSKNVVFTFLNFNAALQYMTGSLL